MQNPSRPASRPGAAAGVDDTEIETEFDELSDTDCEPRRTLRPRRATQSAKDRPSGAFEAQRPRASSRTLPPLSNSFPLAERLKTFRTRTLWTLILVFAFFPILMAGHFYCSCLVLLLTIAVYHEIISLRHNDSKENQLPLFYLLTWYWFLVAIGTTGPVWLFPLLRSALRGRDDSFLSFLMAHHYITTYIAAFVGFVLFILSLRKFSLRYQFSKFAFLLLTCLLVVGQSLPQIANIYQGLIWFFLSCSCVIVNDVFAYIFGTFFGRTRLIKLSPKKTVEGYLGASVVTIGWAVVVATVLSKYSFFYCPTDSVELNPVVVWAREPCARPYIFRLHEYPVPQVLRGLLGADHFTAMPMQFHGLILGVFAGFFAPFGGFFASGLKRALRIKDFGRTIPGHGGFTDRFDCQIIMGMFTFLYIRSFVLRRFGAPTVAGVLNNIKALDYADQHRVFSELKNLLS